MFEKTMQRLETLDHLIKIKGTGSPDQLAIKLGISRTQVFEYLNFMRDHGANITFCKYRESYCYSEDGSFIFGFIKKEDLHKRENSRA